MGKLQKNEDGTYTFKGGFNLKKDIEELVAGFIREDKGKKEKDSFVPEESIADLAKIGKVPKEVKEVPGAVVEETLKEKESGVKKKVRKKSKGK